MLPSLPPLKTCMTHSECVFKSIAKKQHAEHSNFVRVDNNLSVAQGVAFVELPS